jgi:ADP-ribosylglycohydrolase
MEPNRKEFIWSATIGTLIGAMLGIMVGLSMFKEAKRCDALKRENQLLRDMIMNYQEQPPCGE